MPKTTLSSVELAAVVEELQFLNGARISRVYDYEERALLLELHLREKGKQLLRIIPGKFLNLTVAKESPIQPSGFVQQLRKYLDGAFLHSVQQKGGERIVLFEIEGVAEQKGKKFSLMVEFFSKGNIILTDHANVIIACLERQAWKDRTIKPGEKYLFPPAPANWKTVTEAQMHELLQKSNKKSVIISLALELGLGGLYAEELCSTAGIDKEKVPSSISFSESACLIGELQHLKKKLQKPQGFLYAEEITPFALSGKTSLKTTPTYNEALDALRPFEKTSPYHKKIDQLQKTILSQEDSLQQLQQKIQEESRKGEFIYENYTFFQRLLEHLKELLKSGGMEAVEKEMQHDKRILQVSKAQKKVTVAL